jgi:hypothetical protein
MSSDGLLDGKEVVGKADGEADGLVESDIDGV